MFSLVAIGSLLITVIYAVTILYYAFHWLRNPEFVATTKEPSTLVSIILPVRNEESTINQCMQSLVNQEYPKHLFEVIVVNDHSQDKTQQLVRQFDQFEQVKTVSLMPELVGKKAAIQQGIKVASGHLIITTDADCMHSKGWIKEIAIFYEMYTPKMIIAPVALNPSRGFLGMFQQLEFLSLAMSTAGAALAGSATMCSGANLAYERQAFEQVGGFSGIDENPSGDDVLLMHKFKKAFPKGITYLKSKKATISTNPSKTLNEFINQRKRWVSKSFSYQDMGSILVALIVLLMSVSLLLSLGLSIMKIQFLKIFMIQFLVKGIVDFFLLYLGALFHRNNKLTWTILLAEIPYSIYVVLISIFGLISKKHNWRGRIS